MQQAGISKSLMKFYKSEFKSSCIFKVHMNETYLFCKECFFFLKKMITKMVCLKFYSLHCTLCLQLVHMEEKIVHAV